MEWEQNNLQKFKIKIILIIFFDWHNLLHEEFVPEDKQWTLFTVVGGIVEVNFESKFTISE